MAVEILYHKEHQKEDISVESLSQPLGIDFIPVFKKSRGDKKCFRLDKKSINSFELRCGFYIGIDWLTKGEQAIQIAPKLNTWWKDAPEGHELNYVLMLFEALQNSLSIDEVEELYTIDWNARKIPVEQQNDFITPFLVVEYILLLKKLVKRGLKKSYVQHSTNLVGTVKGKAHVAKTIKEYKAQNKQLETWCSYETLSVDIVENRILKKALVQVNEYLPQYRTWADHDAIQDAYNFVTPAFRMVSSDVEIKELASFRKDSFYKDYSKAFELADLIFNRLGYNFSKNASQLLETPPFWIDMSKLFELYVLKMLRERFGQNVHYSYKTTYREIDYLVDNGTDKFVIDAKYKPKYKKGMDGADMRQVSGYARIRDVYELFGKEFDKNIDCLIVYPDIEEGYDSLLGVDLKENPIEKFVNIFKVGIKLPWIERKV